MQASLANVIKGQGDNEDIHFEDTVRGSDWGADQHVVRMFVNSAPKAVRELAAWGVPWSRVRRGDGSMSYFVTFFCCDCSSSFWRYRSKTRSNVPVYLAQRSANM